MLLKSVALILIFSLLSHYFSRLFSDIQKWVFMQLNITQKKRDKIFMNDCLYGVVQPCISRAGYLSLSLNDLLPSGFKYSLQDPRMTFPSLSVQRKTPIRTRPSVISILKVLFSHPLSFCFPGVSGLEEVLLYNVEHKR